MVRQLKKGIRRSALKPWPEREWILNKLLFLLDLSSLCRHIIVNVKPLPLSDSELAWKPLPGLAPDP
jgi:hypothetical protein